GLQCAHPAADATGPMRLAGRSGGTRSGGPMNSPRQGRHRSKLAAPESAAMPIKNPRKLFVNIPVKDLKRSMAFFEGLGFSFNPQFTDDTAACMVLSEDGYVMLLTEPKFREFSKKQICDTRTHNEGLFAIGADSRADVDNLVKKAVTTGG